MKTSYGYSLIELMVTLSLWAILLFAAVPAWNTFIARNNVLTGADRIVASLQFTRLEAVKRGINVSFCRAEGAQGTVTDWSEGQKVVEENSQQMIRVLDAVPKQDKLFWKGGLGKNSCITFTSAGVTAGQNGSFEYCPQGKADDALAIIIQAVGAIHISNKTASGESISCR